RPQSIDHRREPVLNGVQLLQIEQDRQVGARVSLNLAKAGGLSGSARAKKRHIAPLQGSHQSGEERRTGKEVVSRGRRTDANFDGNKSIAQ
ncbi:MAG: hypothetical protein KDN05_21365, partial [Verrucomicrobiae bacterium]|nr:hypothetical protein [Verrucomicrobiae bacterium]